MINKSTFDLLITTLFALPILSLATWRISSLLAKEEGPFRIFERIREFCGVEYDADGYPFIASKKGLKGNFGGLLICEWCSSVWIGLFWTVFFFAKPNLTIYVVLPFTISAGAIYIISKMRE